MGQAEVKRVGVMGWPVSHSVSPRLHGYWLNQYGIAGRYDAMEVVPSDLEQALMRIKEEGFAGVNLTLPHKETAMQFMDTIDAAARLVGAVNTVVVNDGRLLGTNTDSYGFMENLRTQSRGRIFSSALVLGAGGAARAVCAGLLHAGCRVVIANRTHARAESLAQHFPDAKLRTVEWDRLQDAMQTTDLLVNTTVLGMKGQLPFSLPLDALDKGAVVADIVYNPLETLLISQAKMRGNSVVTGLGMLLYQGQMAFEAWFGIRPEVTQALYDHVAQAID